MTDTRPIRSGLKAALLGFILGALQGKATFSHQMNLAPLVLACVIVGLFWALIFFCGRAGWLALKKRS